MGGSLRLMVFLVVLLNGGVIGLAVALADVACRAKWEDSGFKSDFGVLKGCVVQRKDGTWVPEHMLRDISP